MNLVVKEHIPMIGNRPKGFYERIKRIPGVFLVSPFEDVFALIKKADFVSVITGTTALEAMMLGKPVLIIGNSPYLAIGEGAVHCSDFNKLTEAIGRTLKTPPATDEKLELYIAAVFSLSFEIPIEKRFESFSKASKDFIINNHEVVADICDKIVEIMDHSDSAD